MNSFQIKLTAIFTMVIDHIGAFFFPDIIFFRLIGRLSFPLFSFLIANGAHYSTNIKKYIGRLLIFALISQIPFYMAHSLAGLPNSLNILFTFFLALVAISILSKIKNEAPASLRSGYLLPSLRRERNPSEAENSSHSSTSLRTWFSAKGDKIFSIVVIASTAAIAYFLKTDYGVFGVLLTISFYLFFTNIKTKTLSFILLAIIASLAPAINANSVEISEIDIGPAISLFSLFFILLYNHKEGTKAKYLFYVFYPLQYVVIYFVKSLM